jgi:hypothetical protein
VTSLPISLPNLTVPTISKDQYKATLDLTQTIWDGGTTKGQKKLASASANTDSRSIENNLYQLKEQISNLYFGVLLADKQFKNAEFTRNDLENQLKKLQANVQNGTVYYAQELSIILNKLQANTRNEILLLAKNILVAVVGDNNGKYWYLGKVSGINLSGGSGGSGTAQGDRSGYTLTFSAMEQELAPEVSSSIIAGLTA